MSRFRMIVGAILIGGALLMATAMAVAAQPEDHRWAWKRQAYRYCDGWGNCYLRYRDVRVRRAPVHYYAPPRRDYDEERWERRDASLERGEHCKPEMVRVVGGLHLTKDGAVNDAVRQWQSTVRYDHGERYMDIENARSYRWRCDRAGTNETLAGRVGEAISGGAGFQRRCVVIAVPCRMPLIKGEKDER